MDTCPGALDPVTRLMGKPLAACCTESAGRSRRASNAPVCSIWRDFSPPFHRRDRRYHATVQVLGEDKAHSEWRRAQLSRDDVPVMPWELERGVIQAPPEDAGRSMD